MDLTKISEKSRQELTNIPNLKQIIIHLKYFAVSDRLQFFGEIFLTQ